FSGNRGTREIALAGRITPASLGVPVPSLDRQFGILAVRYRLPSRGKRDLQREWQQILVDGLRGNAVDAGAQSFARDEVVGGVRDVNRDGLGGGEETQDRDEGKNGGRNLHANASKRHK